MADEQIGNPKITIDADARKAIQEFLKTGKASKDTQKAIEELGAALDTKLNGKVDRSEKAMAAFEKRVHKLGAEITGQGATAKLGELEIAIEKVGGKSKLTEKQLEALERRYRSLVDQGGRASSALAAQFVKTPTTNLGQIVKAESLDHVRGLTASLGPLGGVLGSVGPAGLAAGAGLAVMSGAAVVTARGIANLTQAAADYGDRISDTVAATKMSAESVQRLDHAASKAGIPLNLVTDTVLKMQEALVKAPGKFESLGLSVKELRTLAPEQQLATVGRAINELEDDERRSALARELFGKSWRELAPLMGGALDAMEEVQVLSAEQIADLDALKSATSGLGVEWDRLKIAWGAAIATAPGLKEGVAALADVVKLAADNAQVSAPLIRTFMDAFVTKGALQSLELGLKQIALAKKAFEESKDAASATATTLGFDDPFGNETPELTKKAPKPPSGDPTGIPNAPTGEALEALDRTAGKDLDSKTREHLQNLRDRAAANAELIRMERELAEATAAGAVGIEAAIGKIRASAEAKRQEIIANEAYSASEKARMLAINEATEQVQIRLAEVAAARQTAADAAAQQDAAEKLINETVEEGMSPLDQKLKKIEAQRLAAVDSAHAVFEKAQAEGRDTQELLDNVNAHIKAANAWAKGAKEVAILTERQKAQAAANKIATEAERSLQQTIQRGAPTLRNRIDAINAEIDARIANLEKQRDGNAETEREIELAKKKADEERRIRIEQEKAAQRLDDMKAIGETLGGLADIMTTLEVEGADVFKVIADGWMAGADAAKAYAAATSDAERAAVLAGAAADTVSAAYESKSVGKGALGGATRGAMIGSVIPGVGTIAGGIIGGVIGGVAGGIGDAKDKTDDIMEELARDWGVEISQELANTIQDTMKKLDVGRHTAELMHLDAIFAEAGGVMKFGLEKAIGRTRELFTQLAAGALTVEEVGQAFDAVFGELAANSISKTTGIASDGLRELVALSRQWGIESAGVADYMAQQTASAIANAKRALAGAAAMSPETAKAFGSSIRMLYDEMIRSGMSRSEALEAIGPLVDEARKKFKELGVEGGAAFAELDGLVAFLADEITGPLADSISGTIGLMVDMFNMNALTEESFRALSATVGENYDKLRAMGKDGPAALAAIAPDLQKLWELQQKTGYAVDETTQALIDEAVAAGLVGEEHMSAQDQMLAGIEALTLAIENMGRALLGLPPLTELEVKTKYSTEGKPPKDGDGGDSSDADGNGIPDNHPGNDHAGRSYAVGTTRVGRSGWAKIHEGEAIIPAHRNPFTGAGGLGEMLNWGGLAAPPSPSAGVIGEGGGPGAFHMLSMNLGKLEGRVGELLGEQRKQTTELRNLPFANSIAIRDALQKGGRLS